MKWAVIVIGKYDTEFTEFETESEARELFEYAGLGNSELTQVLLVEIKDRKEQ